jgi:hypothetical protein
MKEGWGRLLVWFADEVSGSRRVHSACDNVNTYPLIVFGLAAGRGSKANESIRPLSEAEAHLLAEQGGERDFGARAVMFVWRIR